jgi:hypothetical protein
VSRVTKVYSREFGSVFFKLSAEARELVEGKIADVGCDPRGFHITACKVAVNIG